MISMMMKWAETRDSMVESIRGKGVGNYYYYYYY